MNKDGDLMNYQWKTIFSLALLVVVAGCSHVEKMVVTQDAKSLTIPYESLGWIQVDLKAPPVQYKRVAGQLGEWASFGFIKNPSQEEYLQGLLNEKIRGVAKERYKAEEVINVKYWPELSAKAFPEGRIGARGEMIRYKRFSA
jgi:hypothetical protein